MNWNGTSVLVTGAGGFIGSHLTERLVREGARVRAFVRYNSAGHRGLLHDLAPDVLHEIEVVAGDIRSAEAMHDAVRGVDTVFHLAAQIAIPYSYLDPRTVFDTNVLGTLNVAEACRRAGVRRMVHTSTSETYGTARTALIDESHPLQGQSPYAASKIGADKLIESYANAFGFPGSIVRPFNTYGPRQSARAIIPTIITQALEGDTLHLGSLHPTRDFTYATDTVAGFLANAAAPADAVVGKAINLGTGQTISIGDLVTVVAEILGRELHVITDEQRVRPEKSEVGRLISDHTLAREATGWQPEVSLKEGLTRTIEWIRTHRERFDARQYAV